MNQQDQLERIRKRELRTVYRNKRLEQERALREGKGETAARKARVNEGAIEALRADNKKPRQLDKKPGPDKFLALYSYIPSAKFDARYSIPPSWKPQSFNERKQHLEFLKSFVHPYPLPETLLWAANAPEYTLDRNGNRIKAPDYAFIRLAKKWIRDIASGESFYKQNKKFFTKAEAHYFLSSKIPYAGGNPVIKLYFYAKCRARDMSHKLSMTAAGVFSLKFFNCFKNNLVEGFLDLIARTPEYRFESGMLGDISDFVLDKMREKRENNFTFSGRTILSVIGLSNEWHERQRREAEAARRENRKNDKSIDTSRWKGLGISPFRHETGEGLWTVTELRTADGLINEGRKMKNCVSSYAYSCASGRCAIFSVEFSSFTDRLINKTATLEVTIANRSLIQAKGKCNTAVPPKTMNVITRWAQANRIKIGLAV